MPPKPSLPLRDGRLGSSSSHLGSSQKHNEPYYSNEDIRLLHEIVTTGEEIFPTLPERDRLPTNALFQAAEQVLPAHGYDPDHPPSNISRLIFKIGGRRSEGSLMDKFSSVLEGMGINLEIVESPEEQQQQHDSFPSAKSSVSAAASIPVDQTGTFPISPRYDVRRRRNSESAAPTAPIEDLRNVPPLFSTKARSLSFGSQPGGEWLDRGVASDENRPPPQSVQVRTGKGTEPRSGSLGEQRAPRHLGMHPLFVREDETDDGFPYRRHDIEEYHESESEPVDRYAPSDISDDRVDQEYDLPRADYVLDHFVGSSDTAAQSDDLPAEPLLPSEDHDAMEEDLRAFRSHNAHRTSAKSLSMWRNLARNTAQRHRHQEAQAVALDNTLLLSECIAEWKEIAETAKSQRLALYGPPPDPTRDEKLERRATKAYNYLIMFRAFHHWHASAQEELERTTIARRHILRERYFTAWRSHQADIESKIYTFRLRTLLRTWRRAAMHHEVREKVAVQTYCQNMVKTVFDAWYDEYRARLADELWSCRLKEKCMFVWQAEIQLKATCLEDCLFYGQRFLQENAISTWREAKEELRRMAYGCTRQKKIRDLQRTLEDWRTLANLNKKLRKFSDERNRQTKGQVIGQWMARTVDGDQKVLLAKTLVLHEFITHWRNATKLKRLKDRSASELKHAVLSQWRLAQKLANYQRSCEKRTKECVLARLRTEADEVHASVIHARQLASAVTEQNAKTSVLRVWRQRTTTNLRQRNIAANRHFFFMTNSCLEHWSITAGEEATRIANLKAFASRGAYYVAASNTLESWAEITKETRRERLTRTYHSFRRRYKVDLASSCLSKWRDATRDSHGLSYDADNIYGGYLRDELADCVGLWRETTVMMQAIREVAKTAEQEVWWGKWSKRAKDLRETELDAAEYCNDQTSSRCWRAWEFAMLQNKGRQHVIATLQENNDRKLCRQVISLWSQKADPDGIYPDLRSSVVSRRSVRYGNVRAVNTPQFGASVNPTSSQPPVQELPHIDETLGEIYTATPRRQHDRVPEPSRNPFISAPKGLSQSLPQRPRGYSKHDLFPLAVTATPQAPISSFPDSVGIPAAQYDSPIHISARQQPSQRHPGDTPYPPPGPRHRPQDDFIEDDVSFAPSEGNDFPATFMSTPTRWTGAARSLPTGRRARTQPRQQPPYRRPASVVATTTTPSALLDTPYERALRREYGGSGGGGSVAVERRSTVGAGRITTPRVTFADIREESGEGLYDEEGGDR